MSNSDGSKACGGTFLNRSREILTHVTCPDVTLQAVYWGATFCRAIFCRRRKIAYHEPGQRQGFKSKLRTEADAVLADAVFQRSPVLSKLLRYLVEETAAGRSQQLKSFVVAVDGLGRSDDFDATSDSSARVQMVRLRKTLENHYAQHGPLDELCIYLQPGSYTVRLGRISTAYPNLYRPLSDAEPKNTGPVGFVKALPTESAITHELPLPQQTAPSVTIDRRRSIVMVSAIVAIASAIVALISWQMFSPAKTSRLSPILELMPVDSGNRPELEQTARLVSSTLASNLPRSKLSRVRVVSNAETLRPTVATDNIYRLFSRLEDNRENGLTLYLNIEDVRTDTSLWSREVPLPAGGAATFNALVPILGEIIGPMGVLATHGNIVHSDTDSGGYPCLLKYFEFVRTREKPEENRVAACIEKPVKEQRMEATILAARSLFTYERSSARKDIAAASMQGLAFARAAVAADPNDGSANFALARFSYIIGDCVSARFYTDRTVETNPYNPMFMAVLAAGSDLCDYPDGEKLLDMAFLTQTPQYAQGRLLLTLAALGQGRPDRLAQIVGSDLPQSSYNRINYYLTETLIAAAQGRRADGVRNWQLYSKTIAPGSRTADEKLRGIVVVPVLRRKLIAFLVKAGIIAG